MSQQTNPRSNPPASASEERAIRAGGTVAGAAILGGAIGASVGDPAWTVIGAIIGAVCGIGISLASAHQAHSRIFD
jgi:hypothetical protein